MQDYPPSPLSGGQKLWALQWFGLHSAAGGTAKSAFQNKEPPLLPLANFWLDSLSKDLLLHLFCPKANSIGWYLPFRRLTGFISLRTHA